MSLKARLRRLDAGVRWLETEGVFIRLELMTKFQAKMQEIADHLALNPAAAAKWKKHCSRIALPPPRVSARPTAPPPVAKPVIAAKTPPPKVEAPRPVQPPVSAAPPPPSRPPEPLPGQPVAPPPPHLEIRPVQWRPRGPQDYYDGERPGTNGRCIVDYDPLRDEDDDDDG